MAALVKFIDTLEEDAESEYLDKDYICGLLNDDKLIQMYLEDIEKSSD